MHFTHLISLIFSATLVGHVLAVPRLIARDLAVLDVHERHGSDYPHLARDSGPAPGEGHGTKPPGLVARKSGPSPGGPGHPPVIVSRDSGPSPSGPGHPPVIISRDSGPSPSGPGHPPLVVARKSGPSPGGPGHKPPVVAARDSGPSPSGPGHPPVLARDSGRRPIDPLPPVEEHTGGHRKHGMHGFEEERAVVYATA